MLESLSRKSRAEISTGETSKGFTWKKKKPQYSLRVHYDIIGHVIDVKDSNFIIHVTDRALNVNITRVRRVLFSRVKMWSSRFRWNYLVEEERGHRKFSHAAHRFPSIPIAPLCPALDLRVRRGQRERDRAKTRRVLRFRSSWSAVTAYTAAIRIRMNSVMRAADTYSWRNSFAGNHEEGSVSSRRRRRSTPFSPPRAVCLRGLSALFIIVLHWTVDVHRRRSGIRPRVCGVCSTIDLKADRPVDRGIKHEERIFIRVLRHGPRQSRVHSCFRDVTDQICFRSRGKTHLQSDSAFRDAKNPINRSRPSYKKKKKKERNFIAIIASCRTLRQNGVSSP